MSVAVDDVDEEDIVFDQTTLLTRRVKPLVLNVRPGRCSRIVQTLLLCAAFFGLGLCIAMPGPTLLDLENLIHTNTSGISRIFTGRSIGYLAGSITGGFLYDRLNQNCLISLSLILTAIGTALAPVSKTLPILVACIGLQGVSMGFLDTGGNVYCLTLWGRNSPPYMQALHFSFGLGAFVAPFIAEPFLSRTIFFSSETNVTNITNSSQEDRHARSARAVQLIVSEVGANITSNDYVPQISGLLGNVLHKPLSERRPTKIIYKGGSETLPVKSFGTLQNRKGSMDESFDQEAPGRSRLKRDASKTEESASTPSKKPPLKPSKTSSTNTDPDGTRMAKKIKKLTSPTKEPTQKPTEPSSSSNGTNNTSIKTAAAAATTTPTTTTTTTTAKPTTTTTTTTTVKPTTTTTTSPTNTKSTVINSTAIPGASPAVNETETSNTMSNETNPITKMINQMTAAIPNLTNVQFAYLTIALYLIVLSFLFMVMCCASRQGIYAMRSSEVQPEYMIKKETRGFRVQILILLFFFYFLYVGMEATYGGLVMSFAVKQLHWTKQQGTLLTSLFWGSFALGRGFAIFAGVCMSPALMLIADLVMTCLALAGLVMGLDSNSHILWFCTAVLGAGMASIFPTGITWAERYMRVTGKATSVLVVGSALGAMIFPAMTGYLFDIKGPTWLLYMMLGAGMLAAILYIIMQNLASNKGERYEKLTHWLRSSGAELGNDEAELEMDSLASNSTTNLLEILSPSSSSSNVSSNGKKKVSFNLPKEINPKNISVKYRPSFMGKSDSKKD